MFRRVAVREVDGRRNVGHQDDESVRGEGLPRYVRAIERGELHRQLFEHRMGEHRAVGDQDGAGHGVVLRLSEEVGGDELRVGALVGDDEDLRRAGEQATVAYGDKGVGTNHVLPTMGAARYTGGLWVGKFLKTCTYQQLTEEGTRRIAPTIEAVATAERMEGHALTATMRLERVGS